MRKAFRLYVIPLVIVLLVAGILLAGCGGETTKPAPSAPSPAPTPAPSPDTVYKLSFALFQPEAAAVSKANTEYANEIVKRTNGRVQITVHQGGSLLGAPAMYQGIIDGIA